MLFFDGMFRKNEVLETFKKASKNLLCKIEDWQAKINHEIHDADHKIYIEEIKNVQTPVYGLRVFNKSHGVTHTIGKLWISSDDSKWHYYNAAKASTVSQKITRFGKVDEKRIRSGCEFFLKSIKEKYMEYKK